MGHNQDIGKARKVILMPTIETSQERYGHLMALKPVIE